MAPHKRLTCLLLIIASGWCQAEISREARLALAGRHYSEAITLLEPAAASGDADSAYELGKLYRLGKGVEPDQATAAYWFNIAAAAGHLPAGYLLAETYLDLDRETEAHDLMASLAADNYPNAQRWLERQAADRSIALLAAIATDTRAGPYSFEAMSRPDRQGATPLILATRKGSERWVLELLDAGVNPDHPDNLGNTALHYAVRSGNQDLARLLLDAGADPDIQSATGASALHISVAAKDVAMSRRLLAANADTSIPDAGNWTVLELVRRSDNAQLRQAFGLSPQQASAASGSKQKRLAEAARNGDLAAIDLLISDGADIESRDRDGHSPMALAITANQLEAVISLHKHYPLAAQREAVLSAAGAGRPEILQWLVNQHEETYFGDEAGASLLAAAMKADCLDCVRLLLAAGSSVNALNGEGEPLLITAARTGNASFVDALARAGADVDVLDSQQRCALWWAASLGDTPMSKHLMTLGAMPLTDADGLAPLHIAAARDHHETTRTLISPETLNAVTASGNTALMLAASRDAVSALKVLLNQEAEIEQRNNAGNTALILATMADAFDSAELLLAAGASATARNDKFQSSRSIIERRDDPRWLALLEGERKSGLLSLFD